MCWIWDQIFVDIVIYKTTQLSDEKVKLPGWIDIIFNFESF